MQGGPVWMTTGRNGHRGPVSADAILRAYAEEGEAALDGLRGRFALALVDHAAGTVILALDPMGIEHLAYAITADGIVFSSSAEAVARFPAVQAPVSRQALFNYLLLHIVPAPNTVYAGVCKLRPGTRVTYGNGRSHVYRYWIPRFEEERRVPVAELAEQLHRALRQGVESASPDDRTGAFLSGGLDSSTVTGVLRDVSGKPPRTFSIGFGVEQYNEIAYARIAARRFGAVAREHEVTPGEILDAFPRIAATYDEPFGNSSAVPVYACARVAAADGVTHLLAGDGGDELFGGNERYARQRVFENYRLVPAALRNRVIEPVVDRIDPGVGWLPLRKLRSYVDQARIPMPERLEYWNFMYQADLGTMLEADFAASVDRAQPLREMAEVYAEAPSNSLLNRMLFLDWHYTLADNDLRKVGSMCSLAGVSVSYPMLHPEVIDVSLQVHPDVKLPGGRLRQFYKDAMRGFLPEEILNKSKHGFGLPFGIWLKSDPAFADMIYSLLTDLKARRIVRSDVLHRLIADQRSGHHSYFGYAIWDLAMLEAWLSAHRR
jgi:asparagine synthase (glutamine-hydrolysing)